MAIETNLNAYQKAIETIVSEGYSVVQIFLNDETAYYYLAHKFTPAAKTPTDDIQYNQIIGINITDFIRNNSIIDRYQFLQKLNHIMTDNTVNVVRFEFPNTTRWFKFAPAMR